MNEGQRSLSFSPFSHLAQTEEKKRAGRKNAPVVGLLEWNAEMDREGLFDFGKEVDVEEGGST